ncbi:MAG: hypothetical protein LBJ01_02955, partial [Tannerella sp.]|nr:hypothetical protein [Tannerella sp.]
SNNLLYANDLEDILFEVDHGPSLVDNNLLGSPINIWNVSQGGAYVHNLFAGRWRISQEKTRYTPYHLPHSTEVAGLSIILNGDDRLYNNLFMPVDPDRKLGYGKAEYEKGAYPSFSDGNAYYHRAVPLSEDKHSVAKPDFDPEFAVEESGKEVYISFGVQGLDGLQTETVTTERLGKAKLPRAAYEQPDGSPIVIDRDYLRIKRSGHPAPGPFEPLKEGKNRIRVW